MRWPCLRLTVGLFCLICQLIGFPSQASAVLTPLNDDAEFVKQAYRDFLNREAEQEGLDYWVEQLSSGNRTRAEVVEQYLLSDEFQGKIAPVVRLYFAYFRRLPDYDGLMYWVNRYSQGTTLDEISGAFAGSDEFQSTYGSLSNIEFIELVYQNVLGRQPDESGLAFWANELDSGNRTRGQVMTGFSESLECRQLIGNRVYVTMVYIGLLRRSPDHGGFEYWVGRMDSGDSGQILIDGFLNSEEYAERFDGWSDEPLNRVVISSNIEFLPPYFLSTNQLRVSLDDDSGTIVFTDSSDTPLKKQSLDGSPPVALANRFDSAENFVLFNGNLYWIDGGNLHRSTPDGETTLLATGKRGPAADVTSDIVVDENYVYWVDQAPNQTCSPPCNWEIQKIPLSGGAPVILATADRRIDSLKGDAENIYWQEASQEPWFADCECGSKIKVVSKSGGLATILVDGSLNGTLPPLPPGHISASWLPTGGFAVTASKIIFAVAGYSSYALKSIPITGGVISDLASVTSSASFARNAVLDITVNGTEVFWLDTANSTLNKIPVAGGAVVTLVGGLDSPSALATNSTTAFWTETGAASECCKLMGKGAIRKIPLLGGAVSTVVDSLDDPRVLAVDAANLVWSEQWRIAEIPSSGGTIKTLVSGISSDLARIAIAQSNVYILDGDLVKVVPLSGGPVEKFASAKLGSIGDFSLINMDIAADDTAIYWSIRGVMGAPILQKLAITGGVPEILANESNLPNPQDCYWRIALDEQYVYWSEGSMVHPIGCTVKKVPLNGGMVTTLIDQAYLADFTVDGINLYFSAGPLIQRMSVSGGAISTVVDNVAALVLANNADSLYWLDLQWNSIGTIPKEGGSSTEAAWLLPIDDIVMDPYLALEGLLVNDEGIFFSESQTGKIYRIY